VMPPSLLLFRLPGRRGLILPVPLFLLWPLLALGYLLVGLTSILLLRPPGRKGAMRTVYTGLELYRSLPGLQIRIRGKDRTQSHFKVV